jgi:hypothetical protein
MSRQSKERLDKYEQFKRQTELPACFKLKKLTDEEKLRALQRMSAAPTTSSSRTRTIAVKIEIRPDG